MVRLILFFACSLFSVANLSAQSRVRPDDPDTLRGLKGVSLHVVLSRTDVYDQQQQADLQKSLQAEAETKFVAAGIRLLKWDEGVMATTPGSPAFWLVINITKSNNHTWPVVAESKLFQNVRLSASPSVELSLPTWESRSFGDYAPIDLLSLHRQVGRDIDKFIRSFLAANPGSK